MNIIKCTKEEHWVHIEDTHAPPHNIFTSLFSKDKDKNIITIWKKMKHILQEPISLPKKHNAMEQSLDSFSECTDFKWIHMKN